MLEVSRVPHLHGHKHLDDDATLNVKPQMKPHICGFTGICHCTGIEGVKMRGCLIAIFMVEYLIPQIY